MSELQEEIARYFRENFGNLLSQGDDEDIAEDICAIIEKNKPEPMPAIGTHPVHDECAARYVPHAKLGRTAVDTKVAALFTVCQFCGGKLEGTAFSHITSQDGLDGLNEIVRRGRCTTLHEQVLAFHKRFGQSIGEKPHVPDEKTVRFRLSLIAEEFFELLEATYDVHGSRIGGAHAILKALVTDGRLKVDLPLFVDALADLDYVIEGARITFGVKGKPIADEVHRANMAKLPSYVAAKDAHHRGDASGERNSVFEQPIKREDGKIEKPPGWTPPDIEGELKKQGWTPT